MSLLQQEPTSEVIDIAEHFLNHYYKDEIAELATSDKDTLLIDWMDIDQWDENEADDVITNYPDKQEVYAQAANKVDLPHPPQPDRITVAFVNLPDRVVFDPLSATKGDLAGNIIGIRGDLAKATVPKEQLTEFVFTCRCGNEEWLEADSWQEPPKCPSCESRRMDIDSDRCNFEDYQRIRVQTRPDNRGEIRDQHIDAEVRGGLVWHGSEVGLLGRTGDSVTVYGELVREQTDEKSRIYDLRLDAHWVEFNTDEKELQPATFKDEFEAYADREDAVDLFAESLVPELYATDEWDAALELLVAYLFGCPRVSLPQGPTYRGDIHGLIISDYGMGKSMVNEAVAEFSPKCIKEAVTGMSSDVGLLAAAVEDDFAGGGWSLEPGILVRGNGGHVILDEIDKADVNLERMNNALEGEQVVDVNKAGQRATFDSKVGLLATGNPVDSRFDAHTPVAEQLDVDPSLLSRFDGIVTMRDETDEETDYEIAQTAGESFLEAFEADHGNRTELERLDRHIDAEVGRNWIHYARENVFPTPRADQVERISEWYSTEIRKFNEEHGGQADDMPVPATPRDVMATLRFAIAFSRVRLADEVLDACVERAMDLGRMVIGQRFGPDGNARPHEAQTQYDGIEAVKYAIRTQGPLTYDDLKDETGLDDPTLEEYVQKLKDQGLIMEPSTGEYRWV